MWVEGSLKLIKPRLFIFSKLISLRLLNGMDKITNDEEYLILIIRITLSS